MDIAGNLKAVRDRIANAAIKALDDDQLRGKTAEFRVKLSQGATLDDLLPEAFAVVREGSKRIMKMRHFDVQLLGGMALHFGKIAEMRTGEGKTLVATLPAYLNALSGKGVHVVTVNDYLAKRDAEWMEPIYRALGLSVGIVQSQMGFDERRDAYAKDVTYGTAKEFGFDFLNHHTSIRFLPGTALTGMIAPALAASNPETNGST